VAVWRQWLFDRDGIIRRAARLEAGALPAELYFNAEMTEESTIFIVLTENGVPSLGMKRGAALETNAKKQHGTVPGLVS